MGANNTIFIRDKDGSITQGPGQVYTSRLPWQTPLAFSAASTTLGVTARAVADVANSTSIQVFKVPTGVNAIKFRATGTADGDINVYDIFFATGDDHYTRAATITCTVGQQTSNVASQEFCDQVVSSNTLWATTWQDVGAADNNYIGTTQVDCQNVDRIAVQCTTFGSAGTVQYTGY
jgi:hypothetical protein